MITGIRHHPIVFLRTNPCATLLFAQLLGVLIYPFLEGSAAGRAVIAVFGLVVLGLALLAVRQTPTLTWVGVVLAMPSVVATGLYVFMIAWNEFLFALLLLQTDNVKTLTVGVLQLQGRFTADYPALMAGLLITSLPVIGAYLIFQRHLVRGIVAGAVK